jgi:hypothetical protein
MLKEMHIFFYVNGSLKLSNQHSNWNNLGVFCKFSNIKCHADLYSSCLTVIYVQTHGQEQDEDLNMYCTGLWTYLKNEGTRSLVKPRGRQDDNVAMKLNRYKIWGCEWLHYIIWGMLIPKRGSMPHIHDIWGSQYGNNGNYHLLGCDAMWPGKNVQIQQMNVLHLPNG